MGDKLGRIVVDAASEFTLEAPFGGRIKGERHSRGITPGRDYRQATLCALHPLQPRHLPLSDRQNVLTPVNTRAKFHRKSLSQDRKNDVRHRVFHRQKQRKTASFMPISNCSTWNNLLFHGPTPPKQHFPVPKPLTPQSPTLPPSKINRQLRSVKFGNLKQVVLSQRWGLWLRCCKGGFPQ